MTDLTLVDTSAWFALAVPWDANHQAAMDWLQAEARLLLTTDYIIDETLTLLKVRGEMARALALGKQFFSGGLASVYYLTEADLHEAWQVFERFTDKDWSFTDCSSKALIDRLGISIAFSFDRHFRQFGSVSVVP